MKEIFEYEGVDREDFVHKNKWYDSDIFMEKSSGSMHYFQKIILLY